VISSAAVTATRVGVYASVCTRRAPCNPGAEGMASLLWQKRRRVAEDLRVEDIAADPRPGMTAPCSIAFSADRKHVGYLLSKPGSRDQVLVVNEIDAEGHLSAVRPFVQHDFEHSAEESLSLEERMRRERTRSWGQGVTSYAWGARTSVALLQVNGSVFLQRGLGGELLKVLDCEDTSYARGPILDPKLSPDETQLAFVRGAEVFVLRIAPSVTTDVTTSETAAPTNVTTSETAAAINVTASETAAPTDVTAAPTNVTTNVTASAPAGGLGTPMQVTHGASEEVCLSHGLADFCAQEEMRRYEGYWWSPCSQWIAFQETDESLIPEFTIVHHRESSREHSTEVHRYPFAGGRNALVRIGVVPASGSEAGSAPLWLDLGISDTAWRRERENAGPTTTQQTDAGWI